ncbi:asparagine synthetase B family protein [Candidatus Pyrohabitans sp.]
MCAIAGGFSASAAGMLELLKHRGSDGYGIFAGDELCLVHALHATHSRDAQPVAGCSGLVLAANGEVYNHRKLRERLASHDFKTRSDCEAILHAVEEHYSGNLLEAVAEALSMLDGEFAFAVSDGAAIVLARDFAGTKPVYFSGRNFASEKKALWAMGEEASSLNPGEVVSLTKRGVGRLGVKRCSIRSVAEPEAELADALVSAVKKRAEHIERFGILFSGGVDSSLIACICANLGYEPRLYAVALPGSLDWKRLRIEKFLGLEVVLEEISHEDVEAAVERVLYAIEESDALKLSIAMPIYLAAELAKANGEKVLLTGQGSDELFAGYARYAALGREELRRELRRDFERLYSVNLERDDKAAMAAQIELLHPYLDRRVVEVALSLPPELKIANGTRKYILRKAARRLGLPEDIAMREKKAVQYSTGVAKALKKLARAEGKSPGEYVGKRFSELFSTS